MKKNDNEKGLLYKIGDVTYIIIDSVNYTLGDTISYLIKAILSIFNREKTNLKILILKKKGVKKKEILDLQTK